MPRADTPDRPLTPRMERFVSEYLIDLNATQAALRAGYGAKSAERAAMRLVKLQAVKARVREAEDARRKRNAVSADRVIAELAKLAFSDLRKVFGPGGALLPPEQWDDDTAAAIASLEVVTVSKGEGAVEHVAKLKAWDKPRNLELLSRHLGLLKDKVELTGKDGGPVEITEIRRVVVDPKAAG